MARWGGRRSGRGEDDDDSAPEATGYDGRYPPRSVPLRTKKGIALSDRRASPGQHWWSRRWIEGLESFGWANRLERGRSYARQGQVLELAVVPGRVTALVQGSRPAPYAVTVRMAPVPSAAWPKIAEALRSDPGLVARLLAGEVPEEMEEIFGAAGTALLPRRARDLETDCSCPDIANPCKHIAAVHYLLAERLDQDPFLIFRLRGKDREEVLDALRAPIAASGGDAGGPAPAAAATATGGKVGGAAARGAPKRHRRSTGPTAPTPDLALWWAPGPRFGAAAVTPHPPAVEFSILRRVGAPAFCSPPEAHRLALGLKEVYRRVSARALATAESLSGTIGPADGGDGIGGGTGKEDEPLPPGKADLGHGPARRPEPRSGDR